jgi:DNA-binding response OmpR family regulator
MSYGDSSASISDLFGKITDKRQLCLATRNKRFATQSSELGEPHSAHYLGMAMTDKTKILIIEDEPGVLMMMVRRLTQAGCDVDAAWNAQAGMQKACEGNFDLITLEVDLPGMNGFEMCRCLKGNYHLSNTPVIFVSGRTSLEDQQQGLELGAADYITKPFDALDFASRILSHAEQARGVCHRLNKCLRAKESISGPPF